MPADDATANPVTIAAATDVDARSIAAIDRAIASSTAGRLARRCSVCDSYQHGRADGVLPASAHRAQTCDACCAPLRRDPVRCPRCLGWARFDDTGALACSGGCAPLALPHRDALDSHVPMPRRTQDGDAGGATGPGECDRVLPYSGWELVLRERVRSVGGTESSDRIVTDGWGLLGMRDAYRWERYQDSDNPHDTRLALAWGTPDDKGNESRSVAGEALAAIHRTDDVRIAEMARALDGFAGTMQGDATVPVLTRTVRRSADATILVDRAVVIASKIHALRCVDAVASSDDRIVECTADVSARMLSSVRAQLLARFDHDADCRREMIREVGGMLCRALVNSIIARGGSYAGVDAALAYSERHTTPFSGYRAALWWAFYQSVGCIGVGATMGNLGAAEYTHRLPSGMQQGGTMAVHPTRTGSDTARNVNAIHMDRDVLACMDAARIGGVWDANPDAARDEVPWVCQGGRPLRPWERWLLRLCDTGVEVAKGEDWRRLAVTEAVDRIRAEALAMAQRARDGTVDASVAHEWGDARHLTTDAAKVALRRARGATMDALVAWGLVPPRVATVTRRRGARDDDAVGAGDAPDVVRPQRTTVWEAVGDV